MIKGRYADIVNAVEGRKAHSITAAEFLHRFVGDVPWAHLDIAGVADDLGRPYAGKGASGWGVRLLVELARGRAAARPTCTETASPRAPVRRRRARAPALAVVLDLPRRQRVAFDREGVAAGPRADRRLADGQDAARALERELEAPLLRQAVLRRVRVRALVHVGDAVSDLEGVRAGRRPLQFDVTRLEPPRPGALHLRRHRRGRRRRGRALRRGSAGLVVAAAAGERCEGRGHRPGDDPRRPHAPRMESSASPLDLRPALVATRRTFIRGIAAAGASTAAAVALDRAGVLDLVAAEAAAQAPNAFSDFRAIAAVGRGRPAGAGRLPRRPRDRLRRRRSPTRTAPPRLRLQQRLPRLLPAAGGQHERRARACSSSTTSTPRRCFQHGQRDPAAKTIAADRHRARRRRQLDPARQARRRRASGAW